ncbi:glycosyltransferase family 4 protein [Leptothoe sp. LEGE 181152]|nr:glycosyltransferase family 4 protein [Leptothoe sp. LEGE 181152]
MVSIFKKAELPVAYRTFKAVNTEPIRVSPSTSQLKLSVITQFFPPDYAATGQLIEELVKQLEQQGMDIKVFSGQPAYSNKTAVAPRLEEQGNVTIVRSRITKLWGGRLRSKALSGLAFASRTILHLIKNCRRRNLVLVTTAPPFLPILGYLANRLLGMPYICLLYDLYPDIAIELGVVSRQNWIARLWHALNKQVWQHAQGLIVLSPAMKQRIVDHCPAVEDKTYVIHSWADPRKIVPIPKKDNWFAQKHGLVDKFTVLYSGNMGRCHDIDTIFEAALLLRNEPIRFVCIGSGAKRDGLIQQVKDMGLNNFVFLPYQDKKVLPYSLTACDLSLVSVSPGMESLVAPSKLYSALASGRPIAAVCPPHTYLRQMLEEGNCGAWFNNGDGRKLAEFIRHLSRDEQTAQAMGHAARACLEENYAPDIIAQQYADVFHQSSLCETSHIFA